MAKTTKRTPKKIWMDASASEVGVPDFSQFAAGMSAVKFPKGSVVQYIKIDGNWDGRLYKVLGTDANFDSIIKCPESSRSQFSAKKECLRLFWLQVGDKIDYYGNGETEIAEIGWDGSVGKYFISFIDPSTSEDGTLYLYFDERDDEFIDLL